MTIKFDEDTYLNHNPDVAAAVRQKQFSSGFEHYLSYGFSEGRSGVAPDVADHFASFVAESPESFIPPAALRKRVHGDESLDSFERMGRIVSLNLHEVLSRLETDPAGQHVLDFGCGCGRVLQFLQRLRPDNRYFGTDIDPETIEWSNAHLSSIGEFETNPDLPPLVYPDDAFDVVFSISVFTHLPEDMHLAWLRELHRVTKPGGHLLLTTHGAHLLNESDEAGTKAMQDGGFHYSVGSGTDGLPGFYQTAFHSERYIHETWGELFVIEDIARKGIANNQDLVICRKAEMSPASG